MPEFHEERCNKCGFYWPADGWYYTRGRRMAPCKRCKLETAKRWQKANRAKRNQHTRNWRRNNPEKYKAEKRRTRLRLEFGLTEVEYEELKRIQGGVCAICENPPAKKNLSVDHCHATGLVRGLLCANCNSAIGLLSDSPEKVRRALFYLQGTIPELESTE